MSEEIASADSLPQQLADARAALTQANNATEAERRARIRLERRAELFAGQLDAWGHLDAARQIRAEIIGGPVITENSYAALLAELDAARALGVWANDRRYWTCGICPACGFGKQLDGSEFHGSGCAIAAYNDATKARSE